MGRGYGAAATQSTTIPNPASEWKDPCRSAMIYHPANLTERHTVVPYKISLKSVPYQPTQIPKPVPVGNDLVSFRYYLSLRETYVGTSPDRRRVSACPI